LVGDRNLDPGEYRFGAFGRNQTIQVGFELSSYVHRSFVAERCSNRTEGMAKDGDGLNFCDITFCGGSGKSNEAKGSSLKAY
jgi:hypothetical protein